MKDSMRLFTILVIALLLIGSSATAQNSKVEDISALQRAEVDFRFGLDPATPLDSRVKDTPASVLKMFEEPGVTPPTAHLLACEDWRKLSAAFAALPPLHRRILSERLRSVSFLDGMPNTALTSTVNPEEPYRLFDITIRAPILKQTASEWLTWKEQSMFDTAGSTLSVSIEAGKRDAIIYVLLHEATHIVDACLGINPPILTGTHSAADAPQPTAFTKGVWADHGTPAEIYHDELRERIRFRPGGSTLPVSQAEAVYGSLSRTPFVSLYGSSSWGEDLAEYVAVYHWTMVMKQPFRIVIRKAGRRVYSYEPMKSSLVRSRIDQMKQFYDGQEQGH
jgi:hypothetical protein